jgi:hypothetical protein
MATEEFIRMRLLCDEVVPIELRRDMSISMTLIWYLKFLLIIVSHSYIEHGCVTFKVEKEMEIVLTLDGTPSLPWKLVDIKILVKSISSDYGAINIITLSVIFNN